MSEEITKPRLKRTYSYELAKDPQRMLPYHACYALQTPPLQAMCLRSFLPTFKASDATVPGFLPLSCSWLGARQRHRVIQEHDVRKRPRRDADSTSRLCSKAPMSLNMSCCGGASRGGARTLGCAPEGLLGEDLSGKGVEGPLPHPNSSRAEDSSVGKCRHKLSASLRTSGSTSSLQLPSCRTRSSWACSWSGVRFGWTGEAAFAWKP